MAPLLPDQLPPAVHELGLLVTLQLIVAAEPVLIDCGASEIVIDGLAMTVTVVEALPEPTLFEHESVKV